MLVPPPPPKTNQQMRANMNPLAMLMPQYPTSTPMKNESTEQSQQENKNYTGNDEEFTPSDHLADFFNNYKTDSLEEMSEESEKSEE